MGIFTYVYAHIKQIPWGFCWWETAFFSQHFLFMCICFRSDDSWEAIVMFEESPCWNDKRVFIWRGRTRPEGAGIPVGNLLEATCDLLRLYRHLRLTVRTYCMFRARSHPRSPVCSHYERVVMFSSVKPIQYFTRSSIRSAGLSLLDIISHTDIDLTYSAALKLSSIMRV